MRRRLLTTMIAVLLAVGGLLGIPLSVVAWWWVADNAHQDLDNRLKVIADQLIRQEGADGRIPPESLDREAFQLLLPPNGSLIVTFPDPTGTLQRTVVGADISEPRLSESIALGAAGTLTLSIPRDEVRNDQFTAASIVAVIVVASVIAFSALSGLLRGGSRVYSVTTTIAPGEAITADNVKEVVLRVNREPVDTAVLANGDEVQIGKFRLVFLTGPRDGGSAGAGAGLE